MSQLPPAHVLLLQGAGMHHHLLQPLRHLSTCCRCSRMAPSYCCSAAVSLASFGLLLKIMAT
jgi:hypothetical protein